MNSEFERRMTEAARLMREGRLGEATAQIKSALGGSELASVLSAAGSHADVIDVQARVVDTDAPSPRPAAPRAGAVAESFTPGSFRNDQGSRDYKLFEPARDGRALPLVVMLHGCTQNPDDFARGTRMNALARERGFLVLYPAQSPAHNPQGCWNWFKHSHQAAARGEPAILAGMVREVMASHDIDPKRVYVAGLSAGGAMAAILGETHPELFAAIGVHSGLAAGAATDVQGALSAMSGAPLPPRRARTAPVTPTIVFHGDADHTVNVVNGARVLEGTGLRERRESRIESTAKGRSFTRRVLVDGQGAERAEQWTIHGAGHAWSGGDRAGSYADPLGPDASAEMLRFFLEHPRT